MRSFNEFLDIVQYYGVNQVCDVRRFPKSRLPHFGREHIEESLKTNRITYHFLGETLGGFRQGGYVTYTKTDSFRKGIAILEDLLKDNSVLIFCAEKLPWRCHRRFIGAHMEGLGYHVHHVIDKGKIWVMDEAKHGLL